AAALAEMTSPDATRLAAALRPGRDLFFRRPRAWLRHGRAVGRTVLAGLPRLGRGPST
ncbi:MAG: hypothetical protein QOI64_1721, partial [Solirubrobacteraceae bacterium]|nr:hypothetical protein [Solirubrobacteraceae bacterium]